jgi:cytochrome oxidase assembly protein ShyY1
VSQFEDPELLAVFLGYWQAMRPDGRRAIVADAYRLAAPPLATPASKKAGKVQG